MTKRCRSCGKPIESKPENPFDPFCSKRCSLVDLGKWFDESYRIPARADELDESEASALPVSDSENEEP